jgi:hypothetical protein
MTSSDEHPFRDAGAATLHTRVGYVPVHWYQPVALVFLLCLFGWAISGETGTTFLEHAAGVVAIGLLFALPRFPIVTLRARVEGGHLVASGRRWPGAETIWTCTTAEAAGFDVELMRDDKGRQYRRIALRTNEGKLFGLTQFGYAGGAAVHARAAARLNAWWETARARRA